MKKQIYLLGVATFLVLNLGCQKDVAIPDYQTEGLYGDWTLYAIAGWPGQDIKKSRFDKISITKGQEVIQYKNGEIVDEALFKLSPVNDDYAEYYDYILTIPGELGYFPFYDSTSYFIGLNQDTLTLNRRCSDCSNYNFVRK